MTALLEYLDLISLSVKISQETLKTITVQDVLMWNAVIMCTVLILLQYFGMRIVHLIIILESWVTITVTITKLSYYACKLLNAFADLLCSKLCQHNWRKPSCNAIISCFNTFYPKWSWRLKDKWQEPGCVHIDAATPTLMIFSLASCTWSIVPVLVQCL